MDINNRILRQCAQRLGVEPAHLLRVASAMTDIAPEDHELEELLHTAMKFGLSPLTGEIVGARNDFGRFYVRVTSTGWNRIVQATGDLIDMDISVAPKEEWIEPNPPSVREAHIRSAASTGSPLTLADQLCVSAPEWIGVRLRRKGMEHAPCVHAYLDEWFIPGGFTAEGMWIPSSWCTRPKYMLQLKAYALSARMMFAPAGVDDASPESEPVARPAHPAELAVRPAAVTYAARVRPAGPVPAAAKPAAPAPAPVPSAQPANIPAPDVKASAPESDPFEAGLEAADAVASASPAPLTVPSPAEYAEYLKQLLLVSVRFNPSAPDEAVMTTAKGFLRDHPKYAFTDQQKADAEKNLKAILGKIRGRKAKATRGTKAKAKAPVKETAEPKVQPAPDPADAAGMTVAEVLSGIGDFDPKDAANTAPAIEASSASQCDELDLSEVADAA